MTSYRCPPPCEYQTQSSHSGPAACPPPCGRDNTSQCPPPSQDVVVTEADSGRTVYLAPGARLSVKLHGSQDYGWTAPHSGDPVVLAEKESAADPDTGNAWGTFVAHQPGKTEVSATQDPACARSTPACMAPSRLWTVTVVIMAKEG